MKKLVSSVLAASMVLSLAACGSSASTDTASSSEAASTSTAATAEAAGEGSGAYTGTPIKIGGIGPITGGAAVYGQAVKNAEELAVKEINAANGSDVFDWKFEDDEHDAEKSVNAYNTLKDWGLQVLAGPVTTTPSIAVAAVYDDAFRFCARCHRERRQCVPDLLYRPQPGRCLRRLYRRQQARHQGRHHL